MIRRPPRSTLSSSSAASDVYKRQHNTSRSQSSIKDPKARSWHRAKATQFKVVVVFTSSQNLFPSMIPSMSQMTHPFSISKSVLRYASNTQSFSTWLYSNKLPSWTGSASSHLILIPI
eukprot:TRINITY_DN19544_c0_g1_i7.p1 TRINITY_DN19544_c0_g1~~TRINITY_DN19544_c0_g1_i7.p1  ORF type:complete len:118 (-),score=28.64 TRINITY_DN19544_c0_g1_i7:204-557(-)